jgi:hypothetical protein
MTYSNHIDDLDILQQAVYCAAQRIIRGTILSLGEKLKENKFISIP